MKIITREEWAASPASLPKVPMRLPATQTFVHHSVTPVSAHPVKDTKAIENIGLSRFGQFSYSFVIHPTGVILEGCGLRRGAHTAGKNSAAFGICHIGDYTTRNPTIQQIDAHRWLLEHLTACGWLEPSAPILAHRDVFATACPGGKLYALLDMIRLPWEENMPNDPNLPDLPNIMGFFPVVNSQTGTCNGYYILADDGQLHAFGPGAPFFGRSEVPSE